MKKWGIHMLVKLWMYMMVLLVFINVEKHLPIGVQTRIHSIRLYQEYIQESWNNISGLISTCYKVRTGSSQLKKHI